MIHTPRLARAQEQRAIVLRRAGAADRAEPPLAAARATYERLGMRGGAAVG